jgi:hypothetical protein
MSLSLTNTYDIHISFHLLRMMQIKFILTRSRCVQSLVAYRYSKCAKEKDEPKPNFNLGECRIVTFKLKWKINKNHISTDRLWDEELYSC